MARSGAAKYWSPRRVAHTIRSVTLRAGFNGQLSALISVRVTSYKSWDVSPPTSSRVFTPMDDETRHAREDSLPAGCSLRQSTLYGTPHARCVWLADQKHVLRRRTSYGSSSWRCSSTPRTARPSNRVRALPESRRPYTISSKSPFTSPCTYKQVSSLLVC